MAWRLAYPAAALVLLAVLPVASAAICTAQGPYGPIQYSCDDRSAPASAGPWWARADVQAIVAFVGLGGSALAGGYAIWRVRARRKALTQAMLDLDRAYADTKAAPEQGIPRLAALRAAIRQRHANGRLDDGHYLELDKRATDYIVRLRFLDLDRRFLGLPPALLGEVRRLVGDGHVSHEDVELVERHAAAFRLPEPRRGELVALVQSWCTEDVAAPGTALPSHELLVR